jgi:hypothetical protein
MEREDRDFVNSLPAHSMRSRLEPHLEFIRELRRKRIPYRQIALILQDRFQLHASISVIHDFLRIRRSQPKPDAFVAPAQPSPSPVPFFSDPEERTIGSPPRSPGDVAAQIAALKARAANLHSTPSRKPVFEYTPGKPLTLLPDRKD